MDNHNCDNVNCNHYNTNGLCCLFNPDNCKYRQLQKENAELKNDMETAIPLLERSVEISESLTKAKEIIEGLMRFCRCFAQHHTEDIRYKEAEQFLKED